MSISKESAALQTKMNEIGSRHASLMRDADHAGAAHCPCDLAKEYRQASEAFWESRKRKPKTDKQLWIDAINTELAELRALWNAAVKRAEAAEAEAAALRERERWIPITERMPEDGVEVLINVRSNVKSAHRVLVGSGLAQIRKWDSHDPFNYEAEKDVTAWKALSAAPERGKDGNRETGPFS